MDVLVITFDRIIKSDDVQVQFVQVKMNELLLGNLFLFMYLF